MKVSDSSDLSRAGKWTEAVLPMENGGIPASYVSFPEATWYMHLPRLKPIIALNLGQEISDDQGSIGLPKGASVMSGETPGDLTGRQGGDSNPRECIFSHIF